MYDINFFKNTYVTKRQIVDRKHSCKDAAEINSLFTTHLSTKPRIFNIETTNHCNMKCIMCQRPQDLNRPLQHMSDHTFEMIASQLEPHNAESFKSWRHFVDGTLRKGGGTAPSENNFYFDIVSRSIILHGFGEPLLDQKLPARVALLTERRIPTYFSCNPCNINLDAIGEMFQVGTGYIKFAIDSLDDQEAKMIRGGKADFTRSYEKVLQVLELKEKLGAETVIVLTMLNMTGDPAKGDEFLRLWRDKPVYAYVKSLDNKWLLRAKGEEKKSSVKNNNHLAEQYCEYAWTSMTILADGSVVPCTQDINGTWTFGNVLEQSLEEIWNSPKYREFRHLHLSGEAPSSFMCHNKCDWNIVSDYYRDSGNGI